MKLNAALARLLTDPVLREAYRENRAEVARQLSIESDAQESFLSMDFADLQAQARTLLNKRFHEVSRILPETIERLGIRAREVFHAYAVTNWPRGHTRHPDDAHAFCVHLARRREPRLSHSEFHRLRFVRNRKRWALHFVRDLAVEGRPRTALQILYRTPDGAPRQSAWFVQAPACFRWRVSGSGAGRRP